MKKYVRNERMGKAVTILLIFCIVVEIILGVLSASVIHFIGLIFMMWIVLLLKELEYVEVKS